jgi:hypothetical protein
MVSTRIRRRAIQSAPGPPGTWLWLRTGSGVAGPVVFTAAWVASSLLQTGHSATRVLISGLAAPDARYPWIMIGGFVVLGGCSVGFGSALREALGGRGNAGLAPALIQAAGVLTVAAGLLRRDQMLLAGSAGESWHNRAHDVLSIPIYAALIVGPLLLARKLRGEPRLRSLRVPVAVSALASAAVLAVFASPVLRPWEAVLQRVAVSLPLAAMAAVALRLWWPHGRSQAGPAGRGAGGSSQQPGEGLLPGHRAHEA